jgi:hypothetical protein
MIITEIDFDLDLEAATGVPLAPQGPRTAGLHASDIYGGLASKLDPERFPADSKPPVISMAIGLAWEQWLERTLIGMGEAVARPPEQVVLLGKTPCYYSPDLIVVNGKTRIGEIKTTRLSSKSGIEGPKMDKYHAQAMLYCHWSEIPYARFYVLFLHGSYGFMKKKSLPGGQSEGVPEFRVYDVEYSQRELNDNHDTHFQFARTSGLIQV